MLRLSPLPFVLWVGGEKASDEGGGVGVVGGEGGVLRAQFTLAINHSPQKSYGGVRRGV